MERIQQCKWYAVSKHLHPNPEIFIEAYGKGVEVFDHGDNWLISCESQTHPGASWSDIDRLEQVYRASLPDDYRHFLSLTNGADLFIHPQSRWPPVSECTILSTEKNLSMSCDFYSTAIESLNFGRAFDDFLSDVDLHYVPIADVLDGNFIALSVHPENLMTIFYLDRESGYMPYIPGGRRYPKVFADTFSEWLYKVLDTHGAYGIR